MYQRPLERLVNYSVIKNIHVWKILHVVVKRCWIMAWSKDKMLFIMSWDFVRNHNTYIDIEKIDLEPHYIITWEKDNKQYMRLVKHGHMIAYGRRAIRSYLEKYIAKHPMLLVYKIKDPVYWDNIRGKGFLVFKALPLIRPLIEVYENGKLVKRFSAKIRVRSLRSVLKS